MKPKRNTPAAEYPETGWRGFAMAIQLLEAVRLGQEDEATERGLAGLTEQELITNLSDDDRRKAFWINGYNAWYQLLYRRHPKAGNRIFTMRQICIAGQHISLDDIEHGLLRRWRWKYSLGYLPARSRSALRGLSVDCVDFRIHFALNCGVAGCPPIRFYQPALLHDQLDLATQSYLSGETAIDVTARRVLVPRLMLWFMADFGGPAGIRNILRQYVDGLPESFRLSFKPYNYTPALGNFSR